MRFTPLIVGLVDDVAQIYLHCLCIFIWALLDFGDIFARKVMF